MILRQRLAIKITIILSNYEIHYHKLVLLSFKICTELHSNIDIDVFRESVAFNAKNSANTKYFCFKSSLFWFCFWIIVPSPSLEFVHFCKLDFSYPSCDTAKNIKNVRHILFMICFDHKFEINRKLKLNLDSVYLISIRYFLFLFS